VYELTGRPISEIQRDADAVARPLVSTLALVPADRAELGARIERRFDAMVEAGLVEEVEQLRARSDLRADLPSMRAVGYRQIWQFLDGECDWAEARRRAIVATRQYAKRQMTWLRGDAAHDEWPAFSPQLLDRCLEWLRREARHGT
jgi:tRNA dimethylallyltransferase